MDVEDAAHPLQERVDEAVALAESDAEGAVVALRGVIDSELTPPVEDAQKAKEKAIYKLADVLAKLGRADDLVALLQHLRPFFETIPKAKTAKITRIVIDAVSRIPDTVEVQVELCNNCIEWCKSVKRTFLRLRIQNRLAGLLVEQTKYQPALQLIAGLLREVKKLDDKPLLVEIHLIESKAHHALRNGPKARAALTAARTAANAIYVGPEVQADIDWTAGTLHCEDRDYKTAYSYFLEAFEALKTMGDARALTALKYMVLCKVMLGKSDEARAVVTGKSAVSYTGVHLEAMQAVNHSYAKRSLQAFEEAVEKYREQLDSDLLLRRHLGYLRDTMLEHNLRKIIEPYSCVEIEFVAKKIQLPLKDVEAKLAEMILDSKLSGTLDQGRGTLIVFEEQEEDKVYAKGLEAINKMGGVVDQLFKRSEKLR